MVRSPYGKNCAVGQCLSDLVPYSFTMRTRSDTRAEQQLSEINGYLELGMEEEALRLIRGTLHKEQISLEEFNTCLFALLQAGDPKQWRKPIEIAYARLTRPVNDTIRANMVIYYFTIGQPQTAFEFFPKRRPTRFFDIWVMMQVCLELSRLDEAKKIARCCVRFLAIAEDEFTKASMINALATYYLRIGEWESALELWRQAPAESTFERQRLCGIVKVHLLQALEAARTGLAKVAAAQQHADLSMEVQLPGNNAALSRDAERDLKSLKDRIDKLLLAADSC